MYAVFGLELGTPSEHLDTLTEFFDESAATLHGAWVDPDSPRSLYLLISGVDEPETVADATAGATGGALLDLDIDPLQLETLGIYANPARNLITGYDSGVLMAAAPPRRYMCPGCQVDLAIEDHLPNCPLRPLAP